LTARPLRIALGQYDTGWHDPARSLERAQQVVAKAAQAGARVVVLPETCTSGFTMESARYAEDLAGSSLRELSRLAKQHKVHILAGVPVRKEDGPACAYNSALLVDPAGGLRAHYDKQRLFALGGEDVAYTPGLTPVITDIDGVRIAPFICYDLRFPELFRAVGPYVDAIVLIANWPVQRRQHWDALLVARAIENQCYVIAVNRIGEGGGASYDGGSVVIDPWGETLLSPDEGDAAQQAFTADIDPELVGKVRRKYPFVQDCRNAAPTTRLTENSQPSLRARGLLETAVYGPDLVALESFYVDIFGLQLISRVPGRLTTLRCGQTALLLFDPKATERTGSPIPPHGTHGAGHVAFVVPQEEMPQWRERLQTRGIAIESQVDWPEGGYSIYFRDPAGNSIELAPPTIWGGLGRAHVNGATKS
jgi:omega-amidase